MNHEEAKKLLFQDDPQAENEYVKFKKEFAPIKCFIDARVEKGMTQKELAKKCGLKQSHISRFESGSYNPSLNFMKKVAKAFGKELIIEMRDAAHDTASSTFDLPVRQNCIDPGITTATTSRSSHNSNKISLAGI